MKTAALITAMLGLSACAADPSSITASYVSPVGYSDYTCQQLIGEAGRLSNQVAVLTGQQQQAASNDAGATAIALLLFWPAVFFIGNEDHAAELSNLKGQAEAVIEASRQRDC